MIFATVGTHTTGLDRLAIAVDDWAAETKERVIAQIGSGVFEPRCAEWFRWDTPERIGELMSEAAVIITHGGAGSLLAALERRKPVVVVPRLARYGEAADDHQLELCIALETQGLLEIFRDGDTLPKAIGNARSLSTDRQDRGGRLDLIAALDRALNELSVD